MSTVPVEQTPEERRIKRALSNMPYLPLASNYYISAEPHHLAETLEKFGEYLKAHAARDEENERDLRQLRSDLAAVRRVFGVGGDQ